MSARERTAYWVQTHSNRSQETPVLSPSSPPSIISDASVGPAASDAASSHSLPPRMVLRYDDGRPDIPIPHPSGTSSSPRSHSKRSGATSPRSQGRHSPHHSRQSSSQGRSRAGSQAPPVPQPPPQHTRHAQTLSYVTVPLEMIEPRPPITPPRSPESIVVLPSRESGDSSRSQVHSVPINSRSIGHSHAPTSTTAPRSPGGSSQSGTPEIASPRPRRAYNSSQRSAQTPLPGHTQPSAFTGTDADSEVHQHQPNSRPRTQSTLPYDYHPPAIIYAPSSNHSRPRYAPPAIVYSPPSKHSGSRGHAPSITYSQSDPLPQTAFGSQHLRFGSHRSGRPSHHSPSTIFEEQGSRSRSRSRGRNGGNVEEGRGSRRGSSRGHGRYRGRSPTPSLDDSDDARSDTSAGTYYVLPTPGQKVQIIVSSL